MVKAKRSRMVRPVLSWLAMVLAVGSLAVASAAEISDVVVKSSAPDLDPESLRQLILGNIQSLPGTEFNPRMLSEDVKRLYGLGTFSDIRTEVTEQPEDKVVLVFFLTPRPTVNDILIEGNDTFSDKRLTAVVEHQPGTPLDQVQISRDRMAIAEKYRASGYYDVEVTSDTRPVAETNTVDLVFTVRESSRAKLKKVLFEGNTVFDDDTLDDEIRTRRQWWRYIFRFGNYFNEQQLSLDKDILRDLYASKGYLDFQVENVEQRFSRNNKWVTVVFHVDEGQPYTVSDITFDIEGDRFSPDELRESVKLEEGETFSSTTEEADLARLRERYERLGYLDLRCYPVHDLNAEDQTVEVAFRIREGVPSRIRDIHIVGNEITRDYVIRRELAIHPGDLGDAGKIDVSEQRLEQLNYFDTVDITPMATERIDLKDLRIQLAEKRTGVFSLGAGFSTEDSVVGFLELAENNFDIRRLFDWPPKGGGQRMRLRTSIGTERTDFRLDFTEPWFRGRRLRLNVELFSSTRSYDDYDQQDTGFGVTLTRPWKTHWRQSAGIRIDRITLDDFSDPPLMPDYSDPSVPYTWPDVPMVEDRTLIDEEGSYWANRFIVGLTRDTRRDFLFPRQGSRISLGGELVSSVLGSYSDVIRLDARGAKFIPVFQRSVIRLRGQLSVAEKISGDDVAIFDRYFAGGASTLRGFDYREVGPADAGENPIGGQSRLLAALELARPVGDFMYVHVFVDAGNVWVDAFDINPGEINASIGLGLQLKALPLRLEYGFPILTDWDHLDDSSGQIHFNIGYFF